MKEILKHLVKGFTRVIRNEEKGYIIKNYNLQKGLPTVNLLDLLQDFREIIDPYSYLAQTSPPIDIALLKALCRQYKNCKYLEIGTWRGESLVNVADVAEECVSISLSDNELRQMGMSEKYIKLQRFFSKNIKNVSHITHNSQTFDFTTLKKKFDVIFVDGDHKYNGVRIDTRNVFKLLRNKNSIIVWHDYGDNSEFINWEVLAGILDGCPPEKRKSLYHVSNTTCAIYSPKKLQSEFLEFPTIPNKKFIINIKAEPLK